MCVRAWHCECVVGRQARRQPALLTCRLKRGATRVTQFTPQWPLLKRRTVHTLSVEQRRAFKVSDAHKGIVATHNWIWLDDHHMSLAVREASAHHSNWSIPLLSLAWSPEKGGHPSHRCAVVWVHIQAAWTTCCSEGQCIWIEYEHYFTTGRIWCIVCFTCHK